MAVFSLFFDARWYEDDVTVAVGVSAVAVVVVVVVLFGR